MTKQANQKIQPENEYLIGWVGEPKREYHTDGFVIISGSYNTGLGEDPFQHEEARTTSGLYIGSVKNAERLVGELRIAPQLITPEHSVCSIGFSSKDGKWYGWSHRAIHGFEVGSKVSKGDYAYNPESKEDFLEGELEFWGSETYHTKSRVEDIRPNPIEGKPDLFDVVWEYTNEVPNTALRGTEGRATCLFPEQLGRGEWEAKTLMDAYRMAVDFARGVN